MSLRQKLNEYKEGNGKVECDRHNMGPGDTQPDQVRDLPCKDRDGGHERKDDQAPVFERAPNPDAK
jgi:hypothetical protein